MSQQAALLPLDVGLIWADDRMRNDGRGAPCLVDSDLPNYRFRARVIRNDWCTRLS
jgi:hypothetical protein